jgi:nucleoside-diphosphate-sugar epimerase
MVKDRLLHYVRKDGQARCNDGLRAGDLLGWKPVVTMDEQLKKTAESFEDNHEYTKRQRKTL